MLQAKWHKHVLQFRTPAGTSRGVLQDKPTYFIKAWNSETPTIVGTGECSTIINLSYDHRPNFEETLDEVCRNINSLPDLTEWPSINFGVEMALLDLANGGNQILIPSAFTRGEQTILINGLIWMGDEAFMQQQVQEKIEQGYRCIKLKIGALDFEKELAILRAIRNDFSPDEIELRVDANGAFAVEDAPSKLQQLAELQLHSIEQPIKQGQHEAMAQLCATSPLPIALDEELIGYFGNKEELLTHIKPQYIILKPSLLGGFAQCNQWIAAAEKHGIGWWATSALESNIGLNAIAQWVFTKNNTLPQGLGTGQLYSNNVESRLFIQNGTLGYQ